MADVTLLLQRISQGDEHARQALAPLVYDELRKLAGSHVRRERDGGAMQATQLVSDAYMRLVGETGVDWDGRRHFYAFASHVMRQILVDDARARLRHKRGAGAVHVSFDEVVTLSADRDADVLAVEDALRGLAQVEPRHAEMVTMRFYGGMTMTEVAEALEMSVRTAHREWALAKAWLRRELAP